MTNFMDEKLEMDEILEIKKEVEKGNTDKVLNLMDKKELETLKDKIIDKEIDFNNNNVKNIRE